MSKKNQPPKTAREPRMVDYASLSAIGARAVLREVLLSKCAMQLFRRPDLEGPDLQHTIRYRGSRVDAGDEDVLASIEFEYVALQNDDRISTVSGTFIVVYDMTDVELADTAAEVLDQFAEVNGLYNSWSYIREIVSSSLSRLAAPPVMLPVFRPPTELPPRGEFAELHSPPPLAAK